MDGHRPARPNMFDLPVLCPVGRIGQEELSAI